jgi:uncharacterized protein (TIGR02231 family)
LIETGFAPSPRPVQCNPARSKPEFAMPAALVRLCRSPASPVARAASLALLTALCTGAGAQVPVVARSSIAQVTIYPGSATVERLARVGAGTRQLVFACLPASLDVQSLSVVAEAPVRVGELAVRTDALEADASCAAATVTPRIRELEDRKALLGAENEALALVTGYLKGVGGGGDASTPRAAPDPKSIAATADALRRTGQDALSRQHQIRRLQEDIDRELAPLLAAREREQAGRARVTRVTVTLDAPKDADVRLSYQIAGPGWTPTYRAQLDTSSGALRLERLAQVAQATGEDWLGVALKLSTGQPRRGTAGPAPRPWQVGILPPQPEVAMKAFAAAPAPAPAPAPMAVRSREAAMPSFDVSVFQGTHATEFSVPQRIDVASGGERVALALGGVPLAATLFSRTVPQQDATAWLVAETPQPEGVWPAGPLQLVRDGAYVGSDTLRAGGKGPLSLPFGRDERVVVQALAQPEKRGTTGFTGARAERTTERVYTVENRHRAAVTLQVLEASPLPTHEDVKVETRFEPAPTTTAWKDQAGITLWQQILPPGQTARFAAGYTLTWPKDARLQESR